MEDFAIQDEWQAHPWLGTVLTASAAVAYSTAGYSTRLIELDILTVLFWRGLYAGLFMSVCIALLHGKETVASVRNIGLPGLLAAILSAAATVCYLNACASQLSPRTWRSIPRGHSSPVPHKSNANRVTIQVAAPSMTVSAFSRGVRAARRWRRPVDCRLKRFLGSEQPSTPSLSGA